MILKKFTSEDIFSLIVIITFGILFTYLGYNNFKDHRNIFPKPDPKEYVYVCPRCKYVTKSTHKFCPNCHHRINYHQIKTELPN